MNQDRKNWLRKFAFGAGLTLLSFLTFGCALTKAIRHPFTPPAMIQEALPPAPAPAPSFSILHPFTPAPAPAPVPVPVKLSSGQTVLMMPATPAAAPATYYAPAPAPVKTAVAKAIDLFALAHLDWRLTGHRRRRRVHCLAWPNVAWH